jgi:hypothetical protein
MSPDRRPFAQSSWTTPDCDGRRIEPAELRMPLS